ncbi:uncharacterized protein PV09_05305 [Verruconis gallopava]|uniref:Uncharacterized protein n=1 Tax=Verruconis gallopava TaxID=253628 RepID=A0A0D2AWM8_9PEZI|nr:uncharacterized protein PV09_05305 [Verruconis gallopava]KIW03544.1 hypothetical protein PV09_05305 [Verruconis gallopava]
MSAMTEGNNLPYVYKRLRMSYFRPVSQMRTILAATLITSLIVLFLYVSESPLAASIRNMAGNPPQKALDPHISQAHLTLELKESDHKTFPPTIMVVATNLHESTTVTLLTWDTPFDDKALQLGLFEIKDLQSGHVLPSLGLKLNRKLPPPKEAFLEIEPRRAIAKELVLDGPGVQLEQGRLYEVRAKGTWKAVWQANVADIGYSNLQKMGGGTGVLSFDFVSNVITIKA